MFRVKRNDFIAGIWELSKSRSILLTGGPGIGKSWTVAQLIRECQRNSRPYLPITAEDFDIRSIDDLATALHFKTDVLTFLRSLGSDPVLIIDGLDALRGEYSQRAFRELIRRTRQEVPSCSIVASIRTFDLQQSEQLKDLLFGSTERSHLPFAEIVVPPFSEKDLLEVTRQVPGIAPLLARADAELVDLLRTPFNLQLAVQLLDAGLAVDELSLMHSQVQLLEKYWRLRVENGASAFDNRAFLRRMVNAMVERKTLSVAEGVVSSEGQTASLVYLQSVEVVRSGVTGRLAFTHNILFDYSVARLLLDEKTVFEFMKADPSRTIFYRPALAFFFHHLWFRDRNLFWNVSKAVFSDESLPERARVIPAVTICEATGHLEDLQPMFSDGVSDATGITVVLRAVQTLGVMNSRRRPIWIAAMSRFQERLDLAFVNEFMSIIGTLGTSLLPGERASVAVIARKLLQWMWTTAASVDRATAMQLGDLGASRIFPIVMKLYDTDPNASKAIVQELLARLGSPRAGSKEAFWLAHEIHSIIAHDPALAREVYRRAYDYSETSDEETSIGPSLVLPLRTNRKQDFSSGLYGLQIAFSGFVSTAPLEATMAAIDAVKAEIGRERPLRGDSAGEIQSFTFKSGATDLTYTSDYSEIWDSGHRDYTSLELLAMTLRNITERFSAKGDDSVATQMMQTMISNASLGVFWKRLIETAALHPAELFSHVFGLISDPQFISAPETTIAVGNLLAAAYNKNSVSNKSADGIELAIERIPHIKPILRYETPESIRNRLLMCIPSERIRSATLSDLAHKLASEQVARKNEPYHRMSVSSRPFTTEDWMQEKGVDTQKPENAAVLTAIAELQKFEHRHLNDVPNSGESTAIEQSLGTLRKLAIDDELPEALSEHARGTMCAVAETVLKDSSLDKESSIAQLCRSIVLSGAVDPSPAFEPKYHLPFDMPSWGSPSPRIEAAQGVAHWLWNWGPDKEILEAFQLLSHDPVPAVRFQIASGLLGLYKQGRLEEFWALSERMLQSEETTGVMIGLFGTLARIAGRDPDKVVALVTAAVQKGLPATERHELTDNLVNILVGLYAELGHQQANQQLIAFESDPLKFHNELSDAVYVASHYVGNLQSDTETQKRAIGILNSILLATYKALNSLESAPPTESKSENIGTLLKVIDSIALRIMFDLDVDTDLRQGDTTLSSDQRRHLYFAVKSVIELLTVRSTALGNHYLAPQTAHNLMVTLNGVLAYDPGPVITYAAAVCRASSPLKYQFDPMAIPVLVQFVERVLADHKDALRDTATVTALGEMLDTFAKASWPEAVQLTFRLDQALR